MNPDRCPVVTTDFDIIHRYLSELTLDELIFQTEDIFDSLSPTEKINYDINRYCCEYTDVEGRINFVRALIDNAVISTVHIPFNYNRDERLINLLKAKQYDFFIPVAREQKEDGAALTDDLEQAQDSITVTNPRWEHVDQDKKSASPSRTMVGDDVYLYVDVTGVPEGATVTFDVFDVSLDPPSRIGSASGKNEQGTARGKWTIEDPQEQGDKLKLEFEGIARSKASKRAPIDLKQKLEFVFSM